MANRLSAQVTSNANRSRSIELFTTLGEARYLAEQFRVEYNTKRPHSSLAYLTPAEFADSNST